MNPSALVTITVSGTVDPSTVSPTLSNTATVSSPDDVTPANNSSNASNPTSPSADLSVIVAPSSPKVVAGMPLDFTITVTNKGVSDAANTSLTFVVPPGYSLTNVSGCTIASGIATCAIGTLAPGATRTFTLTGIVESGYLGATMTLTAAATTTTVDSDPSNNDAAAVVTSSGNAALALSKIASVANATFGDTISFTLTLSNSGPSVAPDATIDDELPAALLPISATAPGGLCTIVGQHVACVATSLSVGGQLVAVVVAKAVATGAIVNHGSARASVTGSANSPTADAMVTIPAAARLVVTKAVNVTNARQNEVLTYSIVIRNDGPDAASDVVVSEPLTAELSFISASVTAGTFDEMAKKWMVGRLANGQIEVLTVQAKVLAVGPITNTVVASGTDVMNAQSTLNANATVEASVASSKLPVSGADSLRLLLIAAMAVCAGSALVAADRRRRRYRLHHV